MSDAELQLFIDYALSRGRLQQMLELAGPGSRLVQEWKNLVVRATMSDVAATVAAPLLSDPLLTRVPFLPLRLSDLAPD